MSNLPKRQLIEMGETKLAGARLLHANKRYANVNYLAAYAVELMLNAVLPARFQADTIPSRDFVKDIYTHDFNKLLASPICVRI
jgi:HEPN domain-containing protein